MSKIKITEFKTLFQTFKSFSISTTFRKTGTACDKSRDPKGTHTYWEPCDRCFRKPRNELTHKYTASKVEGGSPICVIFTDVERGSFVKQRASTTIQAQV